MPGPLAFITYTPIERWGPLSPHGIGTALGFFLGAWIMARRAEARRIPRAEVYNAVTWGALGAIVGARGFYVLGHPSLFHSIGDVLSVWQGGLTMFGGFAGGLALGLAYLRRKDYAIPPALDAAAPGFATGVIVGRIGDLFIADHLGRHTHFFLGYRIPDAPIAPGYTPPYYAPGYVVHPTALYDLLGTLVLLGAILLYERRRPPSGALFALFAAWYGVQRFLIDFTRNRTLIESHLFGLSGSQWAGLAFALAGMAWLVRQYRARPQPLQAAPAPAHDLAPSGGTPGAPDLPSPPPPDFAPPPFTLPPAPPPSVEPPPPPSADSTPPPSVEPPPAGDSGEGAADAP